MRPQGPGVLMMTPMSAVRPIHRDVVSYVRRSARMNESQVKAWQKYHDDWVIEVAAAERETSIAPHAHVDWTARFGRQAPLMVEIGCGTGHAITALAEAHRDANLIGFEVFTPSVASTLSRLARHDLDNVRLVVADGAQGVATLFEPASITELWTFFPDPWHKARHHKRRLVNPDFAAVVASRLVPGGVWRLATDWADYAEAMRDTLDASEGLVNSHDGWAPRFELRPLTKYEQRGLDAGRTVFDLTYRRR